MLDNNEKPRKGQSLGRGLSALLGDNLFDSEGEKREGNVIDLEITLVRPGKYQPRKKFNEENLESLIASIREKGIIQPLIVRPLDTEGYEIIAGERRWRAAKTLGFQTVPVMVRPCSDQEALELALIENIQRDDLNPIEEAEAYQRLMEEFQYTQEQLAKSVSKSRSHIANILRLNQLPPHIKSLIQEGKMTAGHARALLAAPQMDVVAQKVITENLTVRDTERIVRQHKMMEVEPSEFHLQSDALQKEISDILGLPSTITISQKGGSLSIRFHSYEQMDELMDKIRLLKS